MPASGLTEYPYVCAVADCQPARNGVRVRAIVPAGRVSSCEVRRADRTAACAARVWTKGSTTPASTVVSRRVSAEAVPRSVAGPAKNDVVLEAAAYRVGRHRL